MRSLSILLLSCKWLTISYNWPCVTTWESLLSILVSPGPEVVAAVNAVVTSALGGILFNLVQYYNLSSECVTEPYSRNYGRSYY